MCASKIGRSAARAGPYAVAAASAPESRTTAAAFPSRILIASSPPRPVPDRALNRLGEQPPDTRIAEIVEMQPIAAEKLSVGHALTLEPVFHDLVTLEHTDALFARHLFHRGEIVLLVLQGVERRGELRRHQDHLDAFR